jgi:hypothetical protein
MCEDKNEVEDTHGICSSCIEELIYNKIN